MTNTEINPKHQFCSIISKDAGEQLFGTAPETLFWLLIPHPTPWGPKAFEESNLPTQVKEKLTTQFLSIKNSKLLLLRSKNRTKSASTSVLLAFTNERSSMLYSLPISCYEDLLEYDFSGLTSGQAPYGAKSENQTIYLVCTHGRRDICCSKWGLPVYKFIEKDESNLVFECSHVGGHRFAANMIVLPEGLYYGRVNPENVGNIIAAHQKNEIYIENYRGRSCYPQIAQAAEYFIRLHTDAFGIARFRFNKIAQASNESHTIACSIDSTVYLVTMSVRKSQFTIIENCVKPNDILHRDQFSLEEIVKKKVP